MIEPIFHQNYRDDFSAVFRFPEGERPDYPWCMVFTTNVTNPPSGGGTYTAGFDGQEYINCSFLKCPEDGVLILFKQHGLGCGRLYYDYQRQFPNALFSDGIQNRYDMCRTGFMLHNGPTDNNPSPEELTPIVQAALRGYSAYDIAVQNGYKGTDEEYASAPIVAAEVAKEAAHEATNSAADAETAAEKANTATAQIIDPLSVLSHSSCTLDERVGQLERLLLDVLSGAMLIPNLQIKELGVWGGSNLILAGPGAPAKAPDRAGQLYIDLTARALYYSTGNAAVSDWKNA